jgi:hypothetical protein
MLAVRTLTNRSSTHLRHCSSSALLPALPLLLDLPRSLHVQQPHMCHGHITSLSSCMLPAA